jgi:hypothetical protein
MRSPEGKEPVDQKRNAVMRTIDVWLKRVEEFREVALLYRGTKDPPQPSTRVEKVGDDMVVVDNASGQVTSRMPATQMDLNEWYRERPWYEELEDRICPLWVEYTRLNRELAFLPPNALEERIGIKTRVNRVTGELCTYFREMVRIYERTLRASLPDHYHLYEVCYTRADGG